VKRRTSFAYEDQYFHLDEFASPAVETLLEVELTEGQTVPVLPPFIPIERDVTAEPEFRNANLAHRPARGR
jgi:CYTH domain-containing protein